MSEFLGSYGFFILIALLMVVCHLGHGGHRGRREGESDDDTPSERGHQH
jgi:hypothetical protein